MYAATFVAFLDNFAMLPTIGPFARSLGADAAGVGLAVAAYSLANVPGNLLGGLLVDRAGRRRVARAAMVAAAAAVATYPLAGSLAALLGLRLLHGLAGGVLIAALYTLAGDLAPHGARGRTMGRMGAAIGSAAVAAPALAGIVRGLYGFTPTFALVGVAMLAGTAVLGWLAEPPPGARAPGRPGRLTAADRRRLVPACAAVFAFTTGFGVLTAFLPTQVEQAGGSAAMSGGLFGGLALIAVVLMLSRIAGRVDRGSAAQPVSVGLALVAAALVVLAVVGSPGGAIAGCLLFGAGFGVVYPAATGAVASVSDTARGRAFGLFNATYSLGFILGPPAAGRLSLAGLSPYVLAAGVCLVAIGAVLLLAGTRRGDSPAAVGEPPLH